MSGDPALVNGRDLDQVIRDIVAEVLVISADQVAAGTALIRDLGAESIDFLDLIFRLEEALGTRIPYTRWQHFLSTTLAGADLSTAITPAVVRAFAEEQMARV
jgi:acyl carrier protein